MGWNPRFVAFCHSQDMTPEQYRALGRNQADFMSFISRHAREWEAQGNSRHLLRTSGPFDAWLAERYPPPRPPRDASEGAAQLDIFNDTKEPAA